ncbi:MAG: amidohydrolase [Oscillospiraceae bacterium]|nr:amidohydrolase [Oscillospiraceae bacterium]
MRLLLKNCDILATENGAFSWIKNGFLGIDGPVIDYIGKEKPSDYYDREKDMSGKLLIPGLINCHGHTPMVLLRGIGSDLPLKEWLFEKMIPVEDRLTAEDIRVGNQLALLEMISSGTTSYSDMYFETQTAVENSIAAGIRANLCRPVQSFDENIKYTDDFRVRQSMELFRSYHGAADGRIRIDFAIHAEYTSFEHIVEAYSADCKALGGRMHIHLSETKREHDDCVKRYGKTPAEWFRDLGTFDTPTAAAHCVAVTDNDMDILKSKGVSVIHNPSSNLKLGSGFAPIPKMLEMGINVALGTDGAASNNNLNMMEELHLASIMHNGYSHDPVLMKPAETLKIATANGAKLQGRSDTGSLEVGKKADIAAFDLDKPHLMPNFDVMALLTYAAQGSDVYMTMVDGHILYENGEYLTLDEEKIRFEVKAALKRIYG